MMTTRLCISDVAWWLVPDDRARCFSPPVARTRVLQALVCVAKYEVCTSSSKLVVITGVASGNRYVRSHKRYGASSGSTIFQRARTMAMLEELELPLGNQTFCSTG
jgi:hypothetical protein